MSRWRQMRFTSKPPMGFPSMGGFSFPQKRYRRWVFMPHEAKHSPFPHRKRFAKVRGSRKQITTALLRVHAYCLRALPSMHLTEDDITKFQALYKKHFGQEISREQAHSEGVKLVRLMQLIYKPITKVDYERLHGQNRKDDENR